MNNIFIPFNATKRVVLFLLFFGLCISANAQQSELSVEKIMQDPSWMGTFPSNIRWGVNSENIYFDYNPEKNTSDSLYKISLKNRNEIQKAELQEKRNMVPQWGDFNKKRTKKVYTENGNLVLYDLKGKEATEILDLDSEIDDAMFLQDEDKISFVYNDNAFILNLENAQIHQLTHIRKGKKKEEKEPELSDQDAWLEKENLELLQVVNERKEKKKSAENYRKSVAEEEPFTFYLGENSLRRLQVSPNASYAAFQLVDRAENKNTEVPNYVDESGYTANLPARSKVGEASDKVELAIYNAEKDTVFIVDTSALPGITDLPDYTEDYRDKEWEKKERQVIPSGTYFSENGEKAVVNLRSADNKDRWIAEVNLETGALKVLDRQHDDAWIAGPGVGYTYWGGGTMGWLPDNEHIYFQSEETGFSHLYLLDVETGTKKALTKGNYEVFDPFLSNDKKSWYLTTSQVDAGERHFYKMPVMGGKMEQLTQMTGKNEVYLSPDEKYMAILHSSSNQPEELYLKKTNSNAEPEQLTSGESEAFASYNWREPEFIKFEAEDGAMVPARLYLPQENVKNNAAVVFVHGAGYLQNAHKWWSSYFREYMFNNMLTDLGYTVIDIDYRGSAGYGRDWRTGIYRHMGGKDLSDQVDGVKYLIENYDINPQKVGIYGGSYGGFITLMAMFTEPETFQAGAALRSVTDWAHYNHGYTSNILNEPALDPIAYRRSSPIYFAEGLEGDLLIAHGMVDTNVHFQDVVRLAQRLIELGKDDWELAVYPVESHGFVEPSSWTDEYSRILELFNESLLNK
ncbi:prolyl oligopeptidase family serine peptidase [Zunongwangia sp. F363]|uniref:Prolyl oligopeptidase family serine peptidase n=1 Tax=Autumnicola tepida TaxID=3075595 RepID=A0ABU3C6N2_9FLAO|nr:prolyl oligopeptidase family serine peptidase [Zunongwangia sp. F363]MDT0641969.1 prolyl oligopeptidase family serine peptidase [Zunongwangia sp. F363]